MSFRALCTEWWSCLQSDEITQICSVIINGFSSVLSIPFMPSRVQNGNMNGACTWQKYNEVLGRSIATESDLAWSTYSFQSNRELQPRGQQANS